MNGDSLSLIGTLIGNLGFPIAITVYVLIRLDHVLNELLIQFNRVLDDTSKDSELAIRELTNEVRALNRAMNEEFAKLEGLLLGRQP